MMGTFTRPPRVQHLEVKAVPDTVGVDAVEAHFACTVVHAPFDPFQRVPASVFAPALGKDAEPAVHPLDVGGEDHALVTVPLGRRRDEAGVSQCARVDADFIGTALEHPVESSSVLTPPPTVRGMKISLATRVRMSVKRARPSALAVMS